MAISPILDSAARALLANETVLSVVGENIANVDTPDYSRQRAELQADTVIAQVNGVAVGTGVHVQTVDQIVDPLLARRQLGAETDASQQSALSDQLGGLAGVLNDLDQPSLAGALGDFFDAADALGRNPQGLAERATLLARAGALVSEFHRRSAGLADLQRTIDDRYVAVASEVNDQLTRIAQLNGAIVAAEATGQSANASRDQRTAALNQLAQTVGISTTEDAHGAVTVSLAGGATLVAGTDVLHTVAIRTNGVGLDGGALHEAQLADPNGVVVRLPQAFATGELGGLANARDVAVVTASANLDRLVDGTGVDPGLRDAVNAVQQAGIDLDGNSTAAVPLFQGTGAAGIALSGAITVRTLAAAKTTEPGDNANALALADLRSTALPALGGTTFSGYVATEESRVGEDATQAGDVATASSLKLKQIQDQRAGISGVNLNEELTNLLRYQHAFQAASRVLTVGNEVLDELLKAV